jgi:hypothetical protein
MWYFTSRLAVIELLLLRFCNSNDSKLTASVLVEFGLLGQDQVVRDRILMSCMLFAPPCN